MLQASWTIPVAGLFTVAGVNGLLYRYFGLPPSVWFLPSFIPGRLPALAIGLMSVPAWEEFPVSFHSVSLASAVAGYLMRY